MDHLNTRGQVRQRATQDGASLPVGDRIFAAGAADYLVKDTLGDFIALLQVALDGALRQAEIRKARDDAEAEDHTTPARMRSWR